MRHFRLPLIAALAAWSSAVTASDALIAPGVRLAVIDTPHLHALVPAAVAEALKPRIARAEALYVQMAKDAGYTPRRLTFLVTDDVDTHNGFSTVTPIPIINVQLAPALQPSFIFTGHEEFERTLIHELAHHISNDYDANGFRRTLSHIFGRVLPNDYLSLLIAYLSTPAHQTMPIFWHEGIGQWAETEYAGDTAWGGRGRDSLTHMVWRLDAAAGGIPEAGDWRLSYHEWPFGSQAYLYGIAYTRWLAGMFGERVPMWQVVQRQQHRWPFAFNGAPESLLGADHATLIAQARADLQAEQQRAIATLKTRPLTTSKRLTPVHSTVGAPAWTKDGGLFAAWNGPFNDPQFITVDAAGDVDRTCRRAWMMSPARSLPDGTLVFSEAAVTTDPWTRSRVSVVTAGGRQVRLPHERLLQPDLRAGGRLPATGSTVPPAYQVVAIQVQADGSQRLVAAQVGIADRWLALGSITDLPLTVLTTQGRPWSPALRHGGDELVWIETDADGSRLVLARLSANADGGLVLGERTLLTQVRGRILHPVWSTDGKHLFFCADHTGVANAYRLDPQTKELLAVTNTLGGVLACVPSPDGRELAIVDHDHQGSYLARIPNDPAAWPGEAPTIALAWPAPVGKAGQPGYVHQPVVRQPADRGDPAALTVEPYHGLSEIRPLFWTPTTFAVPEGGFGVIGVMADPAFTHQMIGSAGIGLDSASPVGLASWSYSGWPIDVGGVAWQAERAFDEQIVASDGNLYDFVENRRSVEVRLGHGLTGMRRRFQVFVAGGIAEYDPVERAEDDYAGLTTFNRAPFTEVEHYVEATLAYSDAILFPASYTLEDGTSFAVRYRTSGFGGDLEQDRVIALGSYVFSFWPSLGQQLVFGGALGWTDGDEYLQNQFSIGGTYSLNQLPRGYGTTQALGQHLIGGSVAWRTPVWRPFWGHSTTPFVDRQTVLELFFDAAKVSNEELDGDDGDWFRSVGANVHMNWMVWELMVNPGVGIAWQLDGDEDVRGLFGLDFIW
jgi:hypothetical protein